MVPRVEQAVVVVVIKKNLISLSCFLRIAILWVVFSGTSCFVHAGVLPEDRADILIHSYNGGGMDIEAPSFLVRKKVHKKFSMVLNHYIDTLSSASIDVLARASQYSEERIENSVGLDFLHRKSMINMGYTKSDENDFSAKSAHFGVSQDFFGDLTNMSLGYSRGNDTVGKTGDPEFEETVVRQHYRFAVSQILTKNMLMNFGWETITDQGFLGNPYRAARFTDNTAARQFTYSDEVYPQSRTSSAFAIDTMNYLPHRASLHFRYRFYNDSWGITAHDAKVGYVHTHRENWIFEINYRFYIQEGADFYSDLFPFSESQNFVARDKELSAFNDHSIGLGATYEHKFAATSLVKKASINLFFTYIQFNYDDFRDVTAKQANGDFYAAGEEPLYRFSARVTRFFISCWY